jgi:hypothetical protein
MDKFETQPDGTITQADPLDSGDPIHIIDLIMFRLRDFLDEYEFAEIEGFAKRAIRSENIDRLRAEVASLKEELKEAEFAANNNYRCTQVVDNYLIENDLLVIIHDGDGEAAGMNIVESIKRLTQQLAAANGRVEVSALALVKAANMIESDPAVTDTIWYSMSETLWDFMIRTAQEVMNGAALSNLNEDSAG